MSGDNFEPLCILVGIDGSDTSLRAAAYAVGIARRDQARIVGAFIHNTTTAANMVAGAMTAVEAANQDYGRELHDWFSTNVEVAGLAASFVERVGNPYRELVQLADELHADTVVVGASTQAGHKLIGSLAVHLVRDARWPVTVVP